MLTVTEDRVYAGASTNGSIVFTIEGNRLYVGSNAASDCVVTLSGNRILAGSNTTGRILYTIDGNRVYEGSGSGGRPVLTVNRDLENRGSESRSHFGRRLGRTLWIARVGGRLDVSRVEWYNEMGRIDIRLVETVLGVSHRFGHL